jgi:hypothetical protein
LTQKGALNSWLGQELWSALAIFFIELIKHKFFNLISALCMVWDFHFNLLEPIWMHKIVGWSFFVFITLPRNEKQAARTFVGSCALQFG